MRAETNSGWSRNWSKSVAFLSMNTETTVNWLFLDCTKSDEEPRKLDISAFELEQFRSFAVRQLVWLLLLPLPDLNEDDQKVLAALSSRISGVSQARVLALEFRRLLLEKDVEALESWFSTVKSSGLPDLVSFVTYLERERLALAAAITCVWSNGRTEAIPPARCVLGSRRSC